MKKKDIMTIQTRMDEILELNTKMIFEKDENKRHKIISELAGIADSVKGITMFYLTRED